MKKFIFAFIFVFVSSLCCAKEISIDDLDSSINTLKASISDVYSVSEVLKILEAPKNRRVVLFRVSGFYEGYNSYTYLAVFEKSQKAKIIQGETYEYFGNIHFRLIGYIQIGGHLLGNIDLENVKVVNDTINVPITYNGSDLLRLNGELQKNSESMVIIKINSFGLSVTP